MRHIMTVRFPIKSGNKALTDPNFGAKMKDILAEIKAEAAYFTTMNGQRGAYIIVNLEDASKIPSVAEPFFLWMNADIEIQPVMVPEDLAKAGPAIGAAVKKWGA